MKKKDEILYYKILKNKNSIKNIIINLEQCINNIGQRLNSLVESYKFFYYSLGVDYNLIQENRRIIEMKFPYQKEESIDIKRKNAEFLVNYNFVSNLMQIIHEEIIEIIIMLGVIKLFNKNKKKMEVFDKRKEKERLQKLTFPNLIGKLEKESGDLILKENILSINQLRRIIVHRSGIVDKTELELKLYIPKFLIHNSFEFLSDPFNKYEIKRDEIIGGNTSQKWKKGEEIDENKY
jgi:hypothetical protein